MQSTDTKISLTAGVRPKIFSVRFYAVTGALFSDTVLGRPLSTQSSSINFNSFHYCSPPATMRNMAHQLPVPQQQQPPSWLQHVSAKWRILDASNDFRQLPIGVTFRVSRMQWNVSPMPIADSSTGLEPVDVLVTIETHRSPTSIVSAPKRTGSVQSSDPWEGGLSSKQPAEGCSRDHHLGRATASVIESRKGDSTEPATLVDALYSGLSGKTMSALGGARWH